MNRIAKVGAYVSAATAIVAAVAPSQARAQAWIGQMAGEMVAQEAAAAREKACLEGAPASPGDIQKASDKAGALMTAYFDLSSQSKPAAVAKVFAMKLPDVSWKSAGGVVPIADLGPRLDEPTPALNRTNFMVGGDAMSARGVWSATPTGEGAAPVIYAVDFSAVPNALWGFAWRIRHITVFTSENAPNPPGAYCHYDPEQAW